MLLIIESDPDFSTKLKKSVRLEGLKTFLVDSLKDAEFLLESMPASLILANLAAVKSAPEVDRLLELASNRKTPTLLIEGFPGTEAAAQRAREQGHRELIKLPFNASDLLTRLKRLRGGDDPLIGVRVGPEGHEVEIVRRLGKGAMGAVYEGLELALERKVAVKFLLAERIGDDDMNRRFRQEARAVAQMRSPNIVRIFFVGSHLGQPYLVMEYIDGPNLSSFMKKRAGLPPSEALRITRQVLAGLEHAHGRGLVHRDLKPANIMLTREGQAIILDFGLVRDEAAQDLTQSGMILGTPRYISPEQIRGRTVDQRADLYAAGIMLYEMLVGRPPFTDKDHLAVLMKHLNEPLPAPPPGQVEPRLIAFIDRLAAKEPDQRFATAADAGRALDSFMSAAGFSDVFPVEAAAADSTTSNQRTVVGPAVSSPSMTGGTQSSTRTPTSVRVVRTTSHDTRPVPGEVIDDLLALFTEFLGPLAPKLARKDARTHGLDIEHLPAARWSDLLNTLAARIDNDAKRDRFVDRAVLLKEKF